MIRRLEVAQSMLHRPRVLFLDEPTVGLDPIARHSVWERLRQLGDEFDTTVFLTTHLMEEADTLCDEVAILHRGVLAVCAPPAALKASLGTEDATMDDVFVRGRRDPARRRRQIQRCYPHTPTRSPDRLRRPARAQRSRRSSKKTYVIAEFEVRKLRHDPPNSSRGPCSRRCGCSSSVRYSRGLRAIPTGGVSYLDFMAPGILAQSVLFVAIFYGIAVIWERDLGTVHKLFVSPTPRAALVLGKALSAGVRSLSQVVIVYTLALLLGVKMNWHPLNLVGVVLAVIVGAACFATLSLIIASIVKTRERFMGIGQVMTMPLFFASNAIYPLGLMPGWLRVVARGNPLSYEVDALRALMIAGGTSAFGLGVDAAVLTGGAVLLIALGAVVYPHVVT